MPYGWTGKTPDQWSGRRSEPCTKQHVGSLKLWGFGDPNGSHHFRTNLVIAETREEAVKVAKDWWFKKPEAQETIKVYKDLEKQNILHDVVKSYNESIERWVYEIGTIEAGKVYEV